MRWENVKSELYLSSLGVWAGTDRINVILSLTSMGRKLNCSRKEKIGKKAVGEQNYNVLKY